MAAPSNAFPIVLVHGFAGWGRDELAGVKYWGGIQGDIQEHLCAQGHTVYTAAVGPFSSNWDRACELFAQIKGGRVDYGPNHSKRHGHARFGRTFPGLYAQWGEIGANGQVNKIHLIGHSMGGQTIRMLTQLLNRGAKDHEDASTHPLFAGGRDWVHSITTISTPHQGALVADAFHGISDLVTDAFVGIFSALDVLGSIGDDLYDAKLDQWGISPKRADETLRQYLERVFASPLFAPGVQDMALYSLSTTGAAAENAWVETLPHVYYFSYTTVDTHASRDHTVQTPNRLTMFFALQPLGAFLGGRYAIEHGFSETWQANDGVVNSVSMRGDGTSEYVVFTDHAQRGVWNGMPALDPMDHIAVIGLTIHTNVLKKLYDAHAKLLSVLPIADDATAAHAELQQIACGCVHDAVTSLRAQAVAAAAAEAAKRHEPTAKSEQEEHDDASRITLVAWEAPCG